MNANAVTNLITIFVTHGTGHLAHLTGEARFDAIWDEVEAIFTPAAIEAARDRGGLLLADLILSTERKAA